MADEYGFGRGAEKQSRRTSRYLFYFLLVELLKQIMAHAAIPTLQEGVTDSILALLSPETQAEGKELGDSAADFVDDYLTQGASENSVEKQPGWNGNLNQFLKLEKVGHIVVTPKLRQLIGDYGRVPNRGHVEKPHPENALFPS